MYEFEPACLLGVKLAGVHWWHKSRSHAAELTAGGMLSRVFASERAMCGAFQLLLHGKHHRLNFQDASGLSASAVGSCASRAEAGLVVTGYYNTPDRNGYAPLLAVLARHNARVSFTCVEMRDCEHPPEAHCSPQGAPAWRHRTAAAADSRARVTPLFSSGVGSCMVLKLWSSLCRAAAAGGGDGGGGGRAAQRRERAAAVRPLRLRPHRRVGVWAPGPRRLPGVAHLPAHG